MTGASWVDIEAILDHEVSDTTLRTRRDEWIAAGIFERLEAEARAAFDKIIALDLGNVALDESLHKAPYGGEKTGPNPTDTATDGARTEHLSAQVLSADSALGAVIDIGTSDRFWDR